jgi:hypothetical protein
MIAPRRPAPLREEGAKWRKKFKAEDACDARDSSFSKSPSVSPPCFESVDVKEMPDRQSAGSADFPSIIYLNLELSI